MELVSVFFLFVRLIYTLFPYLSVFGKMLIYMYAYECVRVCVCVCVCVDPGLMVHSYNQRDGCSNYNVNLNTCTEKCDVVYILLIKCTINSYKSFL